jgi:hypothetical protein
VKFKPGSTSRVRRRAGHYGDECDRRQDRPKPASICIDNRAPSKLAGTRTRTPSDSASSFDALALDTGKIEHNPLTADPAIRAESFDPCHCKKKVIFFLAV